MPDYSLPETPPDEYAPVLEFDDFMTYVLDWRQDQHLGLVGPTGQGKSNLLYWLLRQRAYVTYFATKIKDATLEAYAAKGGYVRIEDWPPMQGHRPFRRPVSAIDMPRRLLWPDATSIHSEVRQIEVFNRAIADIYVQGGWCTVWDDFWYLIHILGLEKQSKKMLLNARSNDIPFVVGTQRPAGNRLVELFDQAHHLFFFRDNDEPNLKRIGGVGWQSSDRIRGFVANLEQYQALYVNTRQGWMYRVTAPDLGIGA
jgi:hypothetical protein